MICKCHYCKEMIEEHDVVVKAINENSKKEFHNGKDCYNRYLFSKHTKCKYCKKQVKYESDYEEYNGGYLHSECVEPYVAMRKEMDDLDKVYKYVKLNLLKYNENVNLSPAQINRLKGLRDGKVGLRKGEKQKYSGYPFHIIYLTLLFKTKDIEYALATKGFKSEESKVDYIAVVVANSINDVYEKVLAKEESDRRLLATVERMQEEKKEDKVYSDENESILEVQSDVKPKTKINKKILELLEQEDDDQLGI